MKRILSWLLVLAVLVGMLPQTAVDVNAMYTWITQGQFVQGSDFTASPLMAERLDSIFAGNLNIYHDVKCTDPMTVPFGCSDLKNNNIYKYIGPEGGPAICSGTSCWVYANAVYYTLFGESTFDGVAMANSVKLKTPYYPAATYENFVAWGVRPGVGALVRAQGHSLIVLGYDAETLTILDANGDGKGLVSIRIRTWDEVNFTVEYIIQPKAEYYDATYPGWQEPVFAKTYPAACILEAEAGFVVSRPGGDALEQTLDGMRYRAIGLAEDAEGQLWYQVATRDGAKGYLPAENVQYIEEAPLDVAAVGVAAPAHHPEGQAFTLEGSVVTQSSGLTAVSACIYKETETGKTLVAGGEAHATGSYFGLYKSPMDSKGTFGKLPVGAYTYEVAATYERSHVDAEGKVVTRSAAVTLYAAAFQVTDGAFLCNHEYAETVTREPTCGAGGARQVTCKLCATGYGELLPATEAHTYDAQILLEATCTETGIRSLICTACPAGTSEVIDATGHSYGDWQTVTPAQCVLEGLQERLCAHCDAREEQVLPAIGHSYTSQWVEANCSDHAKDLYTCQNCGDAYAVYPESDADWSAVKPEDIPADRLETKTQYRYSDRETVVSPSPELPGYTLEESHWEETENTTRYYVKNWPSGFSAEQALYAAYAQPAPTAADTETLKTEVGEEVQNSWLYYHWCANTYTAGPINRGGKAVPSEKYNTFHAFYSTVSPTTLQAYSDGSYIYSNADCCRDTYWYFAVPVYHCACTTQQKFFTYTGWSEWSDWSEAQPETGEQRKVESRLLYRVGNLLGDHGWTESSITQAPTCLAEGIKTIGCQWCEEEKTEPIPKADHSYAQGLCIWCNAKDPNYITIVPPADETVKLGNRANFTVTVEGPVKAYQWQYQMVEGGPWWNCTQYTKGYNTPTLNVLAAEKREGFLYRCRVTDTNGNKHYSEPARLTVDIPESYAILSQPKDAHVIPGNTTTFHIDTQGEGLRYQWEYHKGVDKTGPQYYWIAMGSTTGCKTDTLTIAGISGSINRDGWAYRCVVTDPNGYIYTTEYAFLKVTAAQITAQPESITAEAGSKAVFSVDAEGEVASYRWQYSTNGGRSWYNSSAATQGYNTDTLTVNATAARNGFLYRCVVMDADGNRLETDPVTLTVE